MDRFVIVRVGLAVLVVAMLAVSACQEAPNSQNIIPELEARYDTLVSGGGTPAQIDSARKSLIQAYLDHVDANPKDSMATSFLHRAAELRWVEPSESREAISLYDRLLSDYPESSRAAEALFMKAYVLNNSLKALEEAKQYYEEFIDKYPDHDLYSSAVRELENLGIPPEQIYQSWEESGIIPADSSE